jgi:hypothetical protein
MKPQNARAIIGGALSIATVFAGVSCTTSTTCAVDSNGNSVCATYTSAYPYDYVYYDPVYATTWGYYPYYVDSYYDPYGYTYVFALPAPVPIADAATGGNVPELLDKAHRAANAVDVGVRAALDPVKELIKTPPQQNSDNIVYGPADVGSGNYQFTLRQLSQSQKRYAWKLEARPMSSTGGLALVAGGTIQVGQTPRRGRGVFGVDCTAMAMADASVTCRGQLLMGFAHPNDGDKILSVGLKGYTPDMSASAPMDAKVFDWRHGDTANHVRVVTKTNLSATASHAPETVAIKLTWIKDVGVRADAAATGGDIPSGQLLKVSTCVPANLAQAQATTTTQSCSSDGTGCTTTSSSMTLTCGPGLETGDVPNPDVTASDPPAGMPEIPTEPTAMPDGSGN